jgi:uncharacterized membrane protein
MAAGYAFGETVTKPAGERRRRCLLIGGTAVALFLVLRTFNLYGDPNHWSPTGRLPAPLSFLSTTKYPASLDFLLMTLGPTILLMPFLDGARGRLARTLTAFGRVPFFYYALHIPLIHALALVVSKIRIGTVSWWLFTNHPMGNPPPPDGYTWSLPLLYLVWATAIALLYPVCVWFAGVRARASSPWVRFL